MPILRSSPMTRPTSFGEHRIQLQETPGDDEKGAAYEISVDIPQGLQYPDLKVELERDGSVVHVSGENHVETDDTTTTTRFSKRFAIGKGLMDTDNLQAHFSLGENDKGRLVLRAPKLAPQPEPEAPATRRIEITTGNPNLKAQQVSDEELRHMNFNDAFDESDSIETGKIKQEYPTDIPKTPQQVSDEELRHKSFTDAFDESDSIETGKTQPRLAWVWYSIDESRGMGIYRNETPALLHARSTVVLGVSWNRFFAAENAYLHIRMVGWFVGFILSFIHE